MMRFALRSIVSGLVVVFGLTDVAQGLAQTATEQREAAVLKARAGHMGDAQKELRAMLAAGADDNGLVAMDLATLLQQDKKPREAVAVFEKAALTKPPDYALLAATRAYRDLRRYTDAARLAREGQQRFPDQTVWPLLLSLVLSDARRPREALAILRQPEVQSAPPVERLLAKGYAWRRVGDWSKAKEAYAEVLKLAQNDQGARAEATKALRNIGSAQTAIARGAPTGTPSAPGENAEAALARVEGQLAALPPSRTDARRRLQREAAVLKARTGHMAEAQAELGAIIAAGDADGLAAMDLATLLQQDQKPNDAVAVFEKATLAKPPDYALLAAARAYRDLHRYDDAERLARRGQELFPTQAVWPLLLSLVLSDAGRTREALAILQRPDARRAPAVERLLAEGYAWRRAGDPYRAIAIYTEALKLAPANKEARTETGAILKAEGAPYAAAEIAGTTPPFAADEAAAMVRWGAQIRSSDPTHRFDGTDVALARIDALLAALPPPPAEAAARRQLRLDRLVALRDRVRMREAIEEGETLRAAAPLPQYAEEAYADALLYLRRPEDALDAYKRALAASPKSVEARYGQFYSAVELEDFTVAYATIDAMVADEPIWRGYQGDPTRYPNSERASAEVTAAQGRFYGNQLGEAWARITGIADAAPANSSARLALYQIANARGWPRQATAEGEIAASLDPRAVGSKIALIEVAIANYRFSDAQQMMTELLAVYPENTAVQRLARDLDAKQRWLIELEAKPSDSEGGGANASGRSLTTLAKVTTPPIDDNWQLFASHDYANARPPEGFVERSRVSAGVQWHIPNLTATLYPSQSLGTLSRAGGGATLDWSAIDEIRLAFAGELYSWDTPLRALLHGITSDSISTKATYRWHESRSVAASFAYQPFSDGNQRFAGGVSYKERLINLPGFDLTGNAEAYASSNSRRNAPYYNPSHDLSVTGGLLAEHVLWRRYENSLVQALKVDGGLYSEGGFHDNWIATINYEHRWRFDPLTEFRYGVLLSRRVYDGSVEKSVTLVVGLTQRF
jgi:biofilm PGA synthesis protein PgaA